MRYSNSRIIIAAIAGILAITAVAVLYYPRNYLAVKKASFVEELDPKALAEYGTRLAFKSIDSSYDQIANPLHGELFITFTCTNFDFGGLMCSAGKLSIGKQATGALWTGGKVLEAMYFPTYGYDRVRTRIAWDGDDVIVYLFESKSTAFRIFRIHNQF